MSTKHSPGPWVASPNDDGRGGDGEWIVCNARRPSERVDQWGVCTIWNQSGGEINGHEDEANAKLIAASPKLAAALVGMLRAYGNCGSPLQQAAADAADEALRDAGVPRT